MSLIQKVKVNYRAYIKGKTNCWSWALDKILLRYSYDESRIGSPMAIVMFDEDSENGLSDRIRGILSIYSLCKQARIPFKIYHVYPFDLTDYLCPNDWDWTISDNEIVRCIPYSRPFIRFVWGGVIAESLMDKIYCYRILRNKCTQKHIYTNVMFNECKYEILFNDLFSPSMALQCEIDKNREAMGNNKYFSVTFRFQQLLGDFKEGDKFEILNADDQKILKDKCRKELDMMIQSMPFGYKCLVTSDSSGFLEDVKDMDRVYVIPGVINHPHFAINGDLPYMKSFVDFYMLMGAEKTYLFVTGKMYCSGFPMLASLCSGKSCIIHKF